MKLLSFLILLSIQVMANPTPVLDCEYHDQKITAKLQIMDSSTPSDEFSKFQTYYKYKSSSDDFFISKLIRYQDMYKLSDRAEEYLFMSQKTKMSFVIDARTMSAKFICPEACSSEVYSVELHCKFHVDLEKLKFHQEADINIELQ